MAIKHSQAKIDQCRAMRAAGSTVRAISAALNIPVSTVYLIISYQVRATLPECHQPTVRGGWLSTEVDFVRENAGTMPAKSIAAHLKRSISSVRDIAIKEKISLALRQTDVDPHDEYLCCELYKEGLTVAVIAQKMELTRRTVNHIIKSYGVR